MSDDTMRDDAMSQPVDDDRGARAAGGAGPSAECAAFDAALGDYLEGALDPAGRAAIEAHRAACARCDALAADLDAIVAEARTLPPLLPSGAATEAMWSAVSARIATPAVPLGAARERAQAHSAAARARFLDGWRRPVAAAAALVLLTAGVTYSVTRTLVGGDRQQVAAAGPERPVRPVSTIPGPFPDSTAQLAPTLASGEPAASPGDGERAARAGGTRAGGAALAASRSAARSAAATYEREIDGLRRIVKERRGELDSTTVAVLERNLAVIDVAIAQSRAALAGDPRSRFLGQQLNSVLDKKLELLRTAALLPSRT